MSLEIFLFGLLLSSTLTGLVTEAIKKLWEEHGWSYRANTLAGIVATVISFLLGSGYLVYTETPATAPVYITIFALVFLSWLCAMVGYDKVIQSLSQLQTYGKDS